MPLLDRECPNCGKNLHLDDVIEGRCIGEPISRGCNRKLDNMEGEASEDT